MRIALFDTRHYDREAFEAANQAFGHQLTFLEVRLAGLSAPLAAGFDAVCAFVNDTLDRPTLETLAGAGVRLVLLRSAGFNQVDLDAARQAGLLVARVPEYSPHAVAEHAFAMILALNRKLPRAATRVRDMNFSLEGLVGFDLCGKTFGVAGTGRIGQVAARIALGFECRVLAWDLAPDEALAQRGVSYVDFDTMARESDVLSLHVPLTPDTHHLIDARTLALMKPGAMLVNTGRGALIDTRALIGVLKSGHLGCAALDVYEEEEGLFFRDLSDKVLQDDVLARLLTFPNVLVTAHQAFLTHEALAAIAHTTLGHARAFEQGQPLPPEATVVGPAHALPG